MAFTNRHASIGGAGFRIANVLDPTDAGPGGGISVLQKTPVGNPDFHTADGELGFRFNVTVAQPTVGGTCDLLVSARLSRINGFFTYNALTGGTSTDFKPGSGHLPTVVVDNLQSTANWIPAPSTLILLGMAGLTVGRRRR